MVKLFLEQLGENDRLQTIDKSRWLYSTEAEREIWPLSLAASNEDIDMFSYFWDKYYLWDSTHLNAIVEVIFSKTTWNEGLLYLFCSETTVDIFLSMSYENREYFIEDLMRWYV